MSRLGLRSRTWIIISRLGLRLRWRSRARSRSVSRLGLERRTCITISWLGLGRRAWVAISWLGLRRRTWITGSRCWARNRNWWWGWCRITVFWSLRWWGVVRRGRCRWSRWISWTHSTCSCGCWTWCTRILRSRWSVWRQIRWRWCRNSWPWWWSCYRRAWWTWG